MKIQYFEDTDTATVAFSEAEVVETKEINENIYADIDKNGGLVSLTIEHASQSAAMPRFAYEIIAK
ncbi:MAG: hypothetical protein OHK0011_21960 [Turneriella sp.]